MAETLSINCSTATCTMDWGAPAPKLTDWLIQPGSPANIRKRPTPGVSEGDYRSFYRYDVQACGENLLAASMLGDLRWWYSQGYKRVTRSADFWAKQFGITSRQKIRTAVEKLVDSGKVKADSEWFNGNETPCYELTDQAIAEMGIVRMVDFNHAGMVDFNHPITVGTKQYVQDKDLTTQSANGKTDVRPDTPSKDFEGNQEKPNPEVVRDDIPEAQLSGSSNENLWIAQKREFNRLAKRQAVSEALEADEVRGLRMLEHYAAEASIDVTRFLQWLTPERWQSSWMMFVPGEHDPNLNIRALVRHRDVFFCGYLHLDQLQARWKNHVGQFKPPPLTEREAEARAVLEAFRSGQQ